MNKRTEIIKAATALADERGLEAVRMTATARRAGVSKPTVYKWFATRDDLLAAVKDEATRTQNARVIAWFILAGF
jgi:AcrR family transcriptional regulator